MNRFYIFLSLVLSVSAFNCQSNTENQTAKLSPQVFKDSLALIDAQLVDVRTAEEYNEGHIKNAINVNYHSSSFKDDIGKLDREKAVFVYCRSGRRSSNSVADFKALGFKTIYDLEGGILNWQKESLDTVTK